MTVFKIQIRQDCVQCKSENLTEKELRVQTREMDKNPRKSYPLLEKEFDRSRFDEANLSRKRTSNSATKLPDGVSSQNFVKEVGKSYSEKKTNPTKISKESRKTRSESQQDKQAINHLADLALDVEIN